MAESTLFPSSSLRRSTTSRPMRSGRGRQRYPPATKKALDLCENRAPHYSTGRPHSSRSSHRIILLLALSDKFAVHLPCVVVGFFRLRQISFRGLGSLL